MMNCPNCETEIDEHEANRCLDAWVADKVFDLTVHPPAFGHDDWITVRGVVAHYSTDIAVAWRIVEEKGYSIWCAGGPDEWTWGAGYWDWEDGKKDLLVYAFGITSAEERLSPMCSTPPLAICRAALKSVYVGEDGK